MKTLSFLYLTFIIILLPTRLNASVEVDSLTIVNGSYGGGWELTSKVTGETLVSLGLINRFKIDTIEGGAGWRALNTFLSDDLYKEDILVQSEPLLSGYLKKRYLKGVRDLRPISLLAAEYSCVIVAYDSHYNNFSDVRRALQDSPEKTPISLGGRKGAGDHITANMIFKAAGIADARNLRYVFSDGGDTAAINHLKQSKNIVGVSGYNSIIAKAVLDNEIRIIGITSAERVDGHLSLKEQGVDIEYANWRGFFARKDISEDKFNRYLNILKKMSESKEWQAVLKENGWSIFLKSGPELTKFLNLHEKKLKEIMQDLNLIEK